MSAILFGIHHGNLTVDFGGAIVIVLAFLVAMSFSGRRP